MEFPPSEDTLVATVSRELYDGCGGRPGVGGLLDG